MTDEKKSPKDLKDAKKVLATAINRPVEDVPDEAMIDNLEAWDSLAHMRLLLALEESVGSELPADIVVSIRSLPDIQSVLSTGTLPAERMVKW